jgi:hypothetical protein
MAVIFGKFSSLLVAINFLEKFVATKCLLSFSILMASPISLHTPLLVPFVISHIDVVLTACKHKNQQIIFPMIMADILN